MVVASLIAGFLIVALFLETMTSPPKPAEVHTREPKS